MDRKGDNFAVTKNGDPMYVFQIDGFWSNVSHLECREIVEKAIENWELECTDCTENRFLKDFDLLKEKTEEPGRKLGKENREKQKENT